MFLLYFGIAAFAALTGFLAATNNLTSVQGGLVAAMGAAAALVGLAEKFLIERSTEATHAEVMKSTLDGQDGERALQAIESKRIERTTNLAKGLGMMLLLFTGGFIAGMKVGYAYSDSFPNHIATPWQGAQSKPDSFEVAIGWLAIGEKLQKTGYSRDQIQALYQEIGANSDAKTALTEAGRVWSGRPAK